MEFCTLSCTYLIEIMIMAKKFAIARENLPNSRLDDKINYDFSGQQSHCIVWRAVEALKLTEV
jgi:hypothetical protein